MVEEEEAQVRRKRRRESGRAIAFWFFEMLFFHDRQFAFFMQKVRCSIDVHVKHLDSFQNNEVDRLLYALQ